MFTFEYLLKPNHMKKSTYFFSFMAVLFSSVMRSGYFYSCLALLFTNLLMAQMQVTGQVADEDGNLIPGVTILISGTDQGTTTDFDGNFSLNVPADAVLEISSIGFSPQSVAVNNQPSLLIVLMESLSELDEVVVTALGISRERKSLGYAITEVSNEEVNTVKDHNIANSLVGKVAGLNITQSGFVGAASRITLRGNNSLTGNSQALIVVDGVPINADGIESGDNVYSSTVTGGGITDINPNDVESISVLKGPNAAALYGSRAGNGVILITTKKGGKSDRLGLTLNTNITFDNPLLLPKFQNQYGQGSIGAPYTDLEGDFGGASWGGRLDGSQQLYYTGNNRPYIAQPTNVEDFFQSGTKAITSISLQKGSDAGAFRFSYTNNNSTSILPNSDLQSHNFNIRGSYNLSDKLSIDAKATNFSQEVSNRQFAGGEGVISYVYGIPRNVAIDDLKTYQVENPGSPDEYKVLNYAGPNSNTGNPYWMLENDENKERRNRFFGFTKINYEFNDWLSAFVRIGADMTNVKGNDITKPGHHFHSTGRMTVSHQAFGELNSEFLITANRDLTDKLNLVLSAGGNLSKRTAEGLSQFGDTFKIPSRYFLANLENIATPNELPLVVKKVNSFYGSANFAYDDFLYLDVTSRNDWSSTLGEDNRSYLYSSASLSALLHRFIDPSQSVFNLLKLRGSWAEVGNDIDPYQLIQTFSVAGQGYLGLTTLSSPDIRLNPDLKPETITSSEFGVEMALLENRLNIDLSVYSIETTDLIFDVPVPPATGFQFFRENVGKVTNKGVEIAVGGRVIQKDGLLWDTSLFFSKNENKLEELIDDVESFTYLTTNSGNVSLRAQLGGGIGDIYGTVWERNDAGDYLVRATGSPIASSPDHYLGNAQPDWLGGWSNTLSFDSFSLRFLIDARIGGQFYSETSAYLDAQGVSQRSLQYRESGITLDAINTDTNSANTASITGQEYWGAYAGIAENYIYDQTNVRLREMALGYQIPNTQSFGIDSASIQLIGRNLFFLHNAAEDVDPETTLGTAIGAQGINSRNLPALRSVGLNLTLNF